MHKNFDIAKNLICKIKTDGNFYINSSKSSGDFFISIELLILLSLIAKNKQNSYLPDIKKVLSSTLNNLPSDKELSTIISDLEATGIIINKHEDNKENLLEDGFGDPWIQWAMLADNKRVSSYLEALDKLITCRSKVIDLGSGTGILGAYCLFKNVDFVNFVEETAIAKYIPKLLSNMKLNNTKKYKIYNTNSFNIAQTFEADVVISELFGNDPFEEGIINTLYEFSKVLIGNNIKWCPNSCEVFVELIDIQSGIAFERVKTFISANNNSSDFINSFLYEAKKLLDFSSLSIAIKINEENFISKTDAISFGKFKLNPPDINFNYEGQKTIIIDQQLDVPALMMWFRVYLYEQISISSSPTAYDKASHWSQIIIPLIDIPKIGEKLNINWYLNETNDFLHVKILNGARIIGER